MHRRVRARLTALATGAALVVPATAASAQPPHVVHVSDGDLYRINVDGSGRDQLTDELGEARDPHVNPQETRIVYGVEEETGTNPRRFTLRTAGIDGNDVRILDDAKFGSEMQTPRWSPSGQAIAYTYAIDLPDLNVRVLDVGTGEDTELAEGKLPTWSPAGDRLAYVDALDQADELRVVRRDGTGDRLVKRYTRGEHVHAAAWHPTRERVAALVRGRDTHLLEIVDVETGETDRVEFDVDVPDVTDTLEWTEDGERLVLEGEQAGRSDGSTDAVLIDPDRDVPATVVDAGEHDVLDPDHVGRSRFGLLARGGSDGDPTTTERISVGNGTEAAVAASRILWAGADGSVHPDADAEALPTPEHAVLSRDDVFADSLAGSALTSHGPMLFSDSESLTTATRDELDRVLLQGATVYLLGGESALSAEIEQAIRDAGFTPERLAGQTRVETALAVADEVRAITPGHRRLVVARAEGTDADPTAGWADSITGGAFSADAQIPVVLTQGDELHPAVADWLAADDPSTSIVLGGEGAISAEVEGDLPNPTRVAGAARDATAAEIAERLWQVDGVPRQYTIVPGYRQDGWTFGLAAAGLARRADAPLLLTDGQRVPDATRREVPSCSEGELVLVGDASIIPESTATELDDC